MTVKTNNKRQVLLTVRHIPPAQIRKLNANDKVCVNRVRINSKNVEIIVSGYAQSEKGIVVGKAIRSMQLRDRKAKRAGFGAEMTVGEVLTVFDDLDSLPKNSFASIELAK